MSGTLKKVQFLLYFEKTQCLELCKRTRFRHNSKGSMSGTLQKGPVFGTIRKGSMSGTLQKGPGSGTIRKGSMSGTLQKGPVSGTIRKGSMSGTLQKGPVSGTIRKSSMSGTSYSVVTLDLLPVIQVVLSDRGALERTTVYRRIYRNIPPSPEYFT